MHKWTGLLIASIMLSGCATYIDGAHQDVRVVTPGVDGAECHLKEPGSFYRAVTPQTIKVDRSEDTLEVSCYKALYHDAVVRVEPELKTDHTWLNVVNGIIPGVGWDVATRSIYHYPSVIEVVMEPNPDALEAHMEGAVPEALAPQRRETVLQSEIMDEGSVQTAPADETMSKSLRK